MRRRDFITLLGSAAASWPLTAHAQQGERVRRIGVLMVYPESDPQGQLRATAFSGQFQKLGWTVGRNLEINYHWGIGNADWIRTAAVQLLQAVPDVIIANGDTAAGVLRQATATVPVVFIAGGDPVAEGTVQSLAHPGGNFTGFTVLEPSLGAKLLELLKELKPDLAKAAFLFNPDNLGNQRTFASAQASGPSFAVEVTEASVREAGALEALMTEWGQKPHFGVVVPPDPFINALRAQTIALAARNRLPVIYGLRAAAAEGGLASYGVDIPDLFRQAATYADRILKGEKPADLPVQLPTKFEFVINRKSAKALGLAVPDRLLATADEVIE